MLWMQQALERLDKEMDNEKTVKKDVILGYLSDATYLQGDVKRAFEFTKELLRIVPGHQVAKDHINDYERKLSYLKQRRDDAQDSMNEKNKTRKEIGIEEYKALCRGERKMSIKTESQLLCFHLNTTSIPYLKLTKVKVEEAFKKPQIVIFHDFLSAKEIDVIKSLAEPKLRRATVRTPGNGKSKVVKYRITKSAWLTDKEHQVVNRITKRIQVADELTDF